MIMSGARKSKPMKLKTSVETVEQSGFDVKQFMGKGKHSHSPVVVLSDEESRTMNLAEIQALPQELPQESQHRSTQSFYVPSTTSVTKKKSSVKWLDPQQAKDISKPKKRRKEKASLSPLLIYIPVLLLIAYFFLQSAQQVTDRASAVKNSISQAMQERVDFHRMSTGWKLNSDRIGVQYDNLQSAPGLAADDVKVKAPDMMRGLPLQGEQEFAPPVDKRAMPVNPSYADARIMYGLQEEQNQIAADKLAEELYIKEFIENARREGYAVKIDKFGNVTSKRLPPEETGIYHQSSEGSEVGY